MTLVRTRSPVAQRTLRLAVAGNPNSGKTTLFNCLTGLRHKVGNYPGVTVEHREGRLNGQPGVVLVDLPGTYSLAARSADERVARDVLLNWLPGADPIDGVLVVVDASNLERNLYLATQILDLNLPAIVVCNMMDVAASTGQRVDVARLSRELDVPVVATVARRGDGIEAVRVAIGECHARIQADDSYTEARRPRVWRASDPIEHAISRLASDLSRAGAARPGTAEGAALLLLAQGSPDGAPSDGVLPARVADQLRVVADGFGVREAADRAARLIAARYEWVAGVAERVVQRDSAATGESLSDRIDRIATHRLAGPLVFAVIMLAMFLSIFIAAEPLMNAIDSGIGWFSGLVAAGLGPGMLTDLLVDGVVGGVGAVVVFFPQICLLFLFIAFLEDSGYMARAAFIMDRIMNRVGLHGRSFIPLLSSYACAVPGIMATRTIENPRDRLATILVAPLMSCSARLPVYLIVISAVFRSNLWLKTGVMFGMYALGTIVALVMATLFKKTLLKGPAPAFIMELPPYRLPRLTAIVRHTWDRAKLFLTRAGTIILAISIVLWGLAYFPRGQGSGVRVQGSGLGTQDSEQGEGGMGEQPYRLPVLAAGNEPLDEAHDSRLTTQDSELRTQDSSEQLRHSYLGRAGRWIEPVIRPLGFDWKVGIGIIASFAAREVFVSTMGVVYGVEGEVDESSAPLREHMQAHAWPDGRKLFTPLTGLSLMVFYVLACQCVSTLAVVKRETQSWRWPAFMFGYMTVLAYGASLLVYQVGTALGWGT